MVNLLAAFLNAAPGAVAQGMIWGIMAIGVFLTFRVLDLADLTVDGSLATGGAVTVVLIASGMNPWAAMAIAFIAGAVAGLVTGVLHAGLRIPAILAGILTQLSLYSINLRIMAGRANQPVSVDRFNLIISQRFVRDVALHNPIWLIILMDLLIVGILYFYFGTERGCAVRATGANAKMAEAQGINTSYCKVLGLALSNGMVAYSGGLIAQFQGSADINMGRGAIVIGLAAVIIGENVFRFMQKNFALRMVAAICGSVLYYIILQFVLLLGLNTNDLKMFTAVIVAVFLAVPYMKESMDTNGKKRMRRKNPALAEEEEGRVSGRCVSNASN